MTKTFQNYAAQGDMMMIRIDQLPSNIEGVKAEDGAYVITHSETGHNHVVMERPNVKLYQSKDDPLEAFLSVIGAPSLLEHKRSFDTHEALEIPPGNYKIRRQREYTPEGFRRAQD